MSESQPSPEEPVRHTLLEDALALVVGCIFVATGLAILHAAGLVAGGMAGTALLVSQFVPLAPGLLLGPLTVPFLVLGYFAIGPLFALRTVLASIGIAALSLVVEDTVRLGVDSPLVAAIAGGTLLGQGMLMLVRHGTGLGGFGVLAVWLLNRFGWPIGRTAIAVDVLVLGVSAVFLELAPLLWSSLCALIMGAIVFLWHRPGVYVGASRMG
ncbi:YitT family protein [Altererythrobacter sp. GH1-8]|uniref:YitT family protein n=1 Tax=Altererythrobacter sp. GH1-8 TaxID=3349333 RepID=UPI00374D05FA